MPDDVQGPMTITDDYRAHQDLLARIFEENQPDHTFDESNLHDIGLFDGGETDQMLVLQTYVWGPSMLECVTVCGFYTKDGNVSIAVNHVDGLATLDDADLMFPPKKED